MTLKVTKNQYGELYPSDS